MPRVFGSPEAANMLLCFRKQLLLSEVTSTLQPDCLLNSHKSTAPVFDTEGCPTNTAISFVKHVGTPAFFKFYLPPPPPMQSLLSILKSVLEKKKTPTRNSYTCPLVRHDTSDASSTRQVRLHG